MNQFSNQLNQLNQLNWIIINNNLMSWNWIWIAGGAGVRLQHCPISLFGAAAAGPRAVVLPADGQVPPLLLLQELCVHPLPLLVRLFLRFLRSGTHLPTSSTKFLFYICENQVEIGLFALEIIQLWHLELIISSTVLTKFLFEICYLFKL